MCTSLSRWMTSNKPSAVYIPLSQKLIRKGMNLGSTSLVQCKYDIATHGRLMMVSIANKALGARDPGTLSNQANTELMSPLLLVPSLALDVP